VHAGAVHGHVVCVEEVLVLCGCVQDTCGVQGGVMKGLGLSSITCVCTQERYREGKGKGEAGGFAFRSCRNHDQCVARLYEHTLLCS
jgi:hypothetical protein